VLGDASYLHHWIQDSGYAATIWLEYSWQSDHLLQWSQWLEPIKPMAKNDGGVWLIYLDLTFSRSRRITRVLSCDKMDNRQIVHLKCTCFGWNTDDWPQCYSCTPFLIYQLFINEILVSFLHSSCILKCKKPAPSGIMWAADLSQKGVKNCPFCATKKWTFLSLRTPLSLSSYSMPWK
jgi:hypothetical protein